MSVQRGNHLRRLALSTAAGLLAIAVATVASPTSAAASGTPTRTVPTASGPLTRSGTDLADAIESLGTTTYPDIYGGIIGVDNGRQVNVYLTTLDPGAEAAFEALAPPGVLAFVAAQRTAKALAAIHRKMIVSLSGMQANGLVPVRFWPDVATGTEQVGIENLTAAKASAVQASLASTAVSVFGLSAGDIATSTTTRTSDTSPFNGGDAITNNTEGCTSGYGVKISGTTYLLTAAHCFAVGTSIRNAACNNAPCTSRGGSDSVMGSITKRDTTNGDLDTEVIGTRGSDLLFTGGIGVNDKADVSGHTTSPVGYQVCQSGAYSGEECGLVIDNTNECQLFDLEDLGLHTFCDLVHAYSPSHGIANQGGDSGGPVFRFSGSSLLATGTVTGYTTSDSVSCVHYTYSGCAWDIYYTNINNVLSHWAATLVT